MNKKNIVVTGCCGTIGHALLHALDEYPQYANVLGIDNDESGLFALEQMFHGKFRFAYGDIRDRQRLEILFGGMDIVLHTAALKHVASFRSGQDQYPWREQYYRSCAARRSEACAFHLLG